MSRAAARELDMIDGGTAMVGVVLQQATFPHLQIRSGETCESLTQSVGTNQLLERRPPNLPMENVMKYALIIAAVTGICVAVPASAEEVGVGVGPVGVTVGAGHDRDRERDSDRTVIRDRDEHRDRDTVVIKKDHDRDGDRDHDKTIIDRR